MSHSTPDLAHTLSPANIAVRRSRSVTAGENALYDTQAACLVFCCGTVFKVSSLPGLVSEKMLSDTLWLYLFMLAADALCLAAALSFSFADGDRLTEGTLSRRVFAALSSLWLMLKGFVYFAYTVVFLMVDLFDSVPPYVVVIVLALPVLYLGIKGLRPIARCAELFAPLLFIVIVFNLAMLETDLDFGRNLPVAAMPAKDFTRTERKGKFPFAVVGSGISFALVAVVAAVAVAMYGAALPFAYNMLIRLAGFNKLSLEIGRMEWAAIFVVIVMAVLSLSLHLWGAGEGCRRAIGSPLPARILFGAGIIVIPLSLDDLRAVTGFSVSSFGYAAFAVSLAFAGMLFLLTAKAKRLAGEQTPPAPRTEDGTLSAPESTGKKEAADA